MEARDDCPGRSAGRPSRHAASMRTGAEYLRSLNDGRQVFVDGEKVKDVTTHPAFREAARSIARLYDIAAAPENRERMTFTSPKTGAAGAGAPGRSRTATPTCARGGCSRETWAEATFGLMGRTPDHVAGFFAGYAAMPERVRGRRASNSPTTSSPSTSTCATIISTPATRSCRRRSTAASPRTSRATRRSMPASSRSATTAS